MQRLSQCASHAASPFDNGLRLSQLAPSYKSTTMLAEAFERGPEVFGKDIPVVSETLGMDETTAIISEVTGEQVRFEAATDESIRGLPFGWAREVANMYQYFRTSAHYNVSAPCFCMRAACFCVAAVVVSSW